MPAEVVKIGPLGRFDNNAYVIIDRATRGSLFVDAPMESAKALDAAKGTDVQRIIVTHRHGDHWANIGEVKQATGAPAFCHESDRAPYAASVDGTVEDGEQIAVGETSVRVIHTPGHTPGSICLLVDAIDGRVLISGDTLFPGGPGRSDSPDALREMIASITSKLLVLPDDTRVYPGHGDNTTIADAKREYGVFASEQHATDLHGDVTWEG